MAEFPSLPLFTDAYLSDTLHLTAAQHGAYLMLLMAAWRTKDCALPDDDDFLSRTARMDKRSWLANKAVVLSFWHKGEDGRIRQARLLDERIFVESKRNRNSQAGKASALKRKERGATKRQPAVNENSTPTPTPTITSPPIGGAVSARGPKGFEEWEQALLAIDGVKGSKLEISPMHPMAALHRDGFDLGVEVIPQLKADVAAAKQANRLGKLSWTTLARKIREARLEPASARPGPAPEVDVDWAKRLSFARGQRTWDVRKWGPMPHQAGCRVPPDLLQPGDGEGWTEWRAAS